MTATLRGGPVTKRLDRDEEGHREYAIIHLVETDDTSDGPEVVMNCGGLPTIGSYWNFGNDSDPWAFCWPNMKVTIHKEREGDPAKWWRVEQKFSTRPLKRCQDESIEDPLLEPQKISGTWTKYTELAKYDKDGDLIRYSDLEPITTPENEWDVGRPAVRIEQNVASLGLATFAGMIDHVNDSALWGLAARCVKLSNVSWERLLYGVCSYYYKRIFDFDVNINTFDRTVADEGTKVLNGHWEDRASSDKFGKWVLDNIGGAAPDADNPSHFIRYKDWRGENSRVLLDGHGLPAVHYHQVGTGTYVEGTAEGAAPITIRKYKEANLLLLGIPTVLA